MKIKPNHISMSILMSRNKVENYFKNIDIGPVCEVRTYIYESLAKWQ